MRAGARLHRLLSGNSVYFLLTMDFMGSSTPRRVYLAALDSIYAYLYLNILLLLGNPVSLCRM